MARYNLMLLPSLYDYNTNIIRNMSMFTVSYYLINILNLTKSHYICHFVIHQFKAITCITILNTS